MLERGEHRKVFPARKLEQGGRALQFLRFSGGEKTRWAELGWAELGSLNPGVLVLILCYNPRSLGSFGLLGFTCVLGGVN